jgi:uncharacterized membrane protein
MDLPNAKALWKPFAVLGAAAAYLTLRWDDIPARWAIHWDLAGRPNGWAERTPLGVYGLIALGAGIVVFMEVTNAVRRSRQPEDARSEGIRAAAVSMLRGLTFATSLLLAFLAVDLPLGPRLPVSAILGLTAVVIGVPLAIGSVRLSRAKREARDLGHVESLEGYHEPFYSNDTDRRLWVPKRYGVGWTVNFAHPLAWPTMLLLLGVPIAIAVLSSLSSHGR